MAIRDYIKLSIMFPFVIWDGHRRAGDEQSHLAHEPIEA